MGKRHGYLETDDWLMGATHILLDAFMIIIVVIIILLFSGNRKRDERRYRRSTIRININ